MTVTKSTAKIQTARSTEGLREALFDELDKLRQGKSNPGRANAVAKLVSGVVETVQLEIDIAKTPARSGEAKDAGLKVHQDGDGNWYWYRTADTDENDASFASEAEAWRNACESNDLEPLRRPH